jgi:hypothetical protein
MPLPMSFHSPCGCCTTLHHGSLMIFSFRHCDHLLANDYLSPVQGFNPADIILIASPEFFHQPQHNPTPHHAMCTGPTRLTHNHDSHIRCCNNDSQSTRRRARHQPGPALGGIEIETQVSESMRHGSTELPDTYFMVSYLKATRAFSRRDQHLQSAGR